MLALQQQQHPLTINNAAIEKIAIIVAMPDEAEPIITALNLHPCDLQLDARLGLISFKGILEGKEIHLIINGYDPQYGVAKVGTDAATLCTAETIRVLNPDTIISAGTAGGYANRGACIGDIYIGSQSLGYHDRHIPIDAYEAYSKGNYPCLEAPAIAHAFNFKTGIISTGNSLAINAHDQAIIDSSGAVVKEMEAAAIAHVATLYQVRVMAVKAITNLVSLTTDSATEFKKNFTLATESLAVALPKIIGAMLGKTPKQLQTPITLLHKSSNEKLANATNYK